MEACLWTGAGLPGLSIPTHGVGDMTRQHLISVTKNDCVWQYERGTGPGGQKRNKTSSKVRCSHPPSGAEGLSDETRSQHQNKRLAFVKMVESKKFQAWLRLETLRKRGKLLEIEEAVNKAMRGPFRLEVKNEGKWKEVEDVPND